MLPMRGSCRAWSHATHAWTCCVSMRSATSISTRTGAEMLFQVITPPRGTRLNRVRIERAIQQVGCHLHRPRLAAAVADRLTSNAHIIATGTDSYRPATSTATTAAWEQNQASTDSGDFQVISTSDRW